MCNIFNCFSSSAHGVRSDAAIFVCESCGEEICEGERYYQVGRSYFHKDCLAENYCNEELLALFGATPRVATREEIVIRIVGVANGK